MRNRAGFWTLFAHCLTTGYAQTLFDQRCPSQLKISSRNGSTMLYDDLVKFCKALEASSAVTRLDLAAALVGTSAHVHTP